MAELQDTFCMQKSWQQQIAGIAVAENQVENRSSETCRTWRRVVLFAADLHVFLVGLFFYSVGVF